MRSGIFPVLLLAGVLVGTLLPSRQAIAQDNNPKKPRLVWAAKPIPVITSMGRIAPDPGAHHPWVRSRPAPFGDVRRSAPTAGHQSAEPAKCRYSEITGTRAGAWEGAQQLSHNLVRIIACD